MVVPDGAPTHRSTPDRTRTFVRLWNHPGVVHTRRHETTHAGVTGEVP
jgi:hypothetical protein